ncbi:MAG: tetratricopeptide repeat protein [Desulfobacca sp.]|uniref:tetratricopeptide repeat protein n=1 Tax=Desulfobacca sp. TaxID=2067990 RepID=UPI00404B78B0
MRRLWLAGILLFLGFLFWQIFAMDPYFYVSAHDLFQRAERALAAGELKEARHWARLAWERDPKNRHYGEFLAWRYLETQQPQEALALFQQLAQQQPPVTVLLGQIQALTHLQRRQEALEVAAAAVKQYPQEVNLLRLTAGLAMQATATQDQALVYYQRLLALEPQDREARQRLVDLLAVRQRYAEAIPLQEQEVAADPDNVQALHQLALLYAWQQDHRAAVPIYRQLLEKAVEDQALRLEAAKNAEAAQDWEQAIVHYLELYTRSGGQKEYALPLARLWSQAGQHGQAAAILAPFMAAAPTVEEQRFYALELLLAGNYGQALQAYRQAWEAGDSHRETILNLARLYGQRQQFRQAAAFWEEARRRQLLDPELGGKRPSPMQRPIAIRTP